MGYGIVQQSVQRVLSIVERFGEGRARGSRG
jgi:hypothetical protein